MRILIKRKDGINWSDITKYVNLPIMINDNKDGTYNSVSFNALFTTSYDYFDVKENLPPKYELKVSMVDDENLETEDNTYWFLTDDAHQSRRRVEKNGLESLYEHQIKGTDRLRLLEDTHLPNYTVTQPKSMYFDPYGISATGRYTINQGFEQNGNPLIINQGSLEILGQMNNGDNTILFSYQDGKHRTRLSKIDETSFNIDFTLLHKKTATAFYYRSQLWWQQKRPLYPAILESENPMIVPTYNTSRLTFNFDIVYYDENDNEVDSVLEKRNIEYESGELPFSGGKITGFPEISSIQKLLITIPKNENAKYVIVNISLDNLRSERNLDYLQLGIDTRYIFIETDISGFSNNDYVKGILEEIKIGVVSSQILSEVMSNKIMLIDLLNKATNDYNANRRNKITISDELSSLLSYEAKEGEYGGYNFKEFVERILKTRGAIPHLTHDNILTYKTPLPYSRYLDFNSKQELEKSLVDTDFYDKVVGVSKNLVSENDVILERIPIGSIETDFSQFTEESSGFVTSQDIYYVKRAILYAPNKTFTFPVVGGGSINLNTNMNSTFHWDITSRLLEKDTYSALPDARFDQRKTSTQPSPRALHILGQGNTIMFTSGSNVVNRIGHRSPNIPAFNPTAGVVNSNIAEYAVNEMLICLAYEELSIPATEITDIYPDWEFDDIKNYVLILEYVPIFKELTTKYISNIPERKGLNWEKKLNIGEKVISFQDNSDILVKEMERKGNNKIITSQNYNDFTESIPTLAIVNDNLYITNKIIQIHNNKTMIDYVMQKNYVLQNEDIRLSVGYDRYLVPYEYTQREIIIENHLIFSRVLDPSYDFDMKGSESDFLIATMFPNQYIERGDINSFLYALLRLKYIENDQNITKNILMRMAKLESRFSLVLTGKFLDNYSAGNQKYKGLTSNLEFTQPYKYTDYKGNVSVVDKIDIGYTESGFDGVTNQARLVNTVQGPYGDYEDYDFNLFPEGERAYFDTKLFNETSNHLLLKDAREAIALNYISFLTTQDEYIKWYSYKEVNLVARLINDVELTDDLDLADIDFVIYESADFDILVSTVPPSLTQREVRFTFSNLNEDDFPNGIVFLNKEGNRYTLCGVIKEPIWDTNNRLNFYIASTRYGKTTDYVEPAPVPITVAPTIEVRYTGLFNIMEFRIRNNDSEPATIMHGRSFTPIEPNVSIGIIEPNAWSDWINGGCQEGICDISITANAKAINKLISVRTQRYVD